MNYFAQKERNSILGHSARRATRRHKKAMAKRRQRPSPVKINAEGPHGAQKKVVIKTSCKVWQGLNQEGARDGTYERLRLGNKLRCIREAGIQTHKGDNGRKSLQLTNSFGRSEGQQKKRLLRQSTKGSLGQGSNCDELRNRKTLAKSQEGGRKTRSAEESEKERRRSHSTGSEDRDGRWKRKTADSIER